MSVSIVLGCGFGDEGKGNVTNWLCKKDPENSLVVRFNGGHQAGHTVIHEGKRHVFSSFGSGTLQKVPTFWSKYCTIYPTGFLNEWATLESIGVTPKMFIDPLCPITTPFDIQENRIGDLSTRHGSCGVGFGHTIMRHETLEHSYRIFAMDLLTPWILQEKLHKIAYRFGSSVNVKQTMSNFIADCKDFVTKVEFLPEERVLLRHRDANIIFEGAQGILLDRQHGIFPHVTRSNTTRKNAVEIIERNGLVKRLYNPDSDFPPTIYYVSRCYQTRHGAGPLQLGGFPLNLVNNEQETNVTNPWQGEFRYAPFSMDLIDYAVDVDRQYIGNVPCSSRLVVTCMDQVGETLNCIDSNGDVYVNGIEQFKESFPIRTIFVNTPEM